MTRWNRAGAEAMPNWKSDSNRDHDESSHQRTSWTLHPRSVNCKHETNQARVAKISSGQGFCTYLHLAL